jgi:hypothetical protein
MPKGKAAFIVEGDLEKDFLQKQCNNKSIIRKIPSNGENVPIERLAAMVKAILDTLKNSSHIFVILDRETRDATAEQLEQELLGSLVAKGAMGAIYVHFADRMIENWIISDTKVLMDESLEIGATEGTEGIGGKGQLKQAFKRQKQSYSERIDGVRLLEKCAASALAQNSPSFARLYIRLQGANLGCPWLGV